MQYNVICDLTCEFQIKITQKGFKSKSQITRNYI